MKGHTPNDPTASRIRVPEHLESAPLEPLSTAELVGEIGSKAMLLVGKEIELARQEMKEDVRSEIAMVKGFAVAAVAALSTVNLLLVAAVFGLVDFVPGWLAALCLAGVTLLVAVIAGAIAWRKRVVAPMDLTRKSVKEDVQWAKEQIA
jgi:hypothetical protein